MDEEDEEDQCSSSCDINSEASFNLPFESSVGYSISSEESEQHNAVNIAHVTALQSQLSQLRKMYKYQHSVSESLRQYVLQLDKEYTSHTKDKEECVEQRFFQERQALLSLLQSTTFPKLFITTQSILQTQFPNVKHSALYVRNDLLIFQIRSGIKVSWNVSDAGVAGKCITSSSMTIIHENNDTIDYNSNVDLPLNLEAAELLVAMPIRSEGEKVLGVFEFVLVENQLTTHSFKSFLELLGVVLSHVIESCWRSVSLESQIQDLSNAVQDEQERRAYYQLMSSSSEGDVISKTAQYVSVALSHHPALLKSDLFFVEEEQQQLWTIVREADQPPTELRFSITEGLLGKVFASQKLQIVVSLSSDNIISNTTLVGVPIFNNVIVAVLRLEYEKDVTKEICEEIQDVASKVGIALHQQLEQVDNKRAWKLMQRTVDDIRLWLRTHLLPKVDRFSTLRQLFFVVESAVENMITSNSAEMVSLFLLNSSSMELVHLSDTEHSRRGLDFTSDVSLGIAGNVVRTCTSRCLNSDSTLERQDFAPIDTMKFLGNLKLITSYSAVPLPIGPGSENINFFDYCRSNNNECGAIGVLLLANTEKDSVMSLEQHSVILEFGRQLAPLLISWALNTGGTEEGEEQSSSSNQEEATTVVSPEEAETIKDSALQHYQFIESFLTQLERSFNLEHALLYISNLIEKKYEFERVSVFLVPRTNSLWTPLKTTSHDLRMTLCDDKRGLPGLCVDTDSEISSNPAGCHQRFSDEYDRLALFRTTDSICIPIRNYNPSPTLRKDNNSNNNQYVVLGCVELANAFNTFTQEHRVEIINVLNASSGWIHKQMALEEYMKSSSSASLELEEIKASRKDEIQTYESQVLQLKKLFTLLEECSSKTSLLQCCSKNLPQTFKTDFGHLFLVKENLLWTLNGTSNVDIKLSSNELACQAVRRLRRKESEPMFATNVDGSVLFASHTGVLHNMLATSLVCIPISSSTMSSSSSEDSETVIAVLELGFQKKNQRMSDLSVAMLECTSSKIASVLGRIVLSERLEIELKASKTIVDETNAEYLQMQVAEQRRVETLEQNKMIKNFVLLAGECDTQRELVHAANAAIEACRLFDETKSQFYVLDEKIFWTESRRLGPLSRSEVPVHKGIFGQMFRSREVVYETSSSKEGNAGPDSIIVASPCFSDCLIGAVVLRYVIPTCVQKLSTTDDLYDSYIDMKFITLMTSVITKQFDAVGERHRTKNDLALVTSALKEKEHLIVHSKLELSFKSECSSFLQELSVARTVKDWIQCAHEATKGFMKDRLSECSFHLVGVMSTSFVENVNAFHNSTVVKLVTQSEALRKAIVSDNYVVAPVFVERRQGITEEESNRLSPVAAVMCLSVRKPLTTESVLYQYEVLLKGFCAQLGHSLRVCEENSESTKSVSWHLSQIEKLNSDLSNAQSRIQSLRLDTELKSQLLNVTSALCEVGLQHDFESVFAIVSESFSEIFKAKSARLLMYKENYVWTLASNLRGGGWSHKRNQRQFKLDQGITGDLIKRCFKNTNIITSELQLVSDHVQSDSRYDASIDGAKTKNLGLLPLVAKNDLCIGAVQLLDITIEKQEQQNYHLIPSVLGPLLSVICASITLESESSLEVQKLKKMLSVERESSSNEAQVVETLKQSLSLQSSAWEVAQKILQKILVNTKILASRNNNKSGGDNDDNDAFATTIYEIQKELERTVSVKKISFYFRSYQNRDRVEKVIPSSLGEKNGGALMSIVSGPTESFVINQILGNASKIYEVSSSTTEAEDSTEKSVSKFERYAKRCFVEDTIDASNLVIYGIPLCNATSKEVFGCCIVVQEEILQGSKLETTRIVSPATSLTCTALSIVCQLRKNHVRLHERVASFQRQVADFQTSEITMQALLDYRNEVLHRAYNVVNVLGPEALCERVEQDVKLLLKCQSAHLYTFDDGFFETISADKGVVRIASHVGLLGKTFSTEESFVVSDGSIVDECNGHLEENAVFVIVWNVEHQKQGLVVALGKKGFTSTDVAALEDYAKYVGVALSHASTYEKEVDKRKDSMRELADVLKKSESMGNEASDLQKTLVSIKDSNAALKHEVTRHSRLLDFSRSLFQCTSSLDIFNTTLSSLCLITDKFKCTRTYYINHVTKEMHLKSKDDDETVIVFSVNQGLTGLAARTGEDQWLSRSIFTAGHDENVDGLLKASEDVGVHNVLVCMPSNRTDPNLVAIVEGCKDSIQSHVDEIHEMLSNAHAALVSTLVSDQQILQIKESRAMLESQDKNMTLCQKQQESLLASVAVQSQLIHVGIGLLQLDSLPRLGSEISFQLSRWIPQLSNCALYIVNSSEREFQKMDLRKATRVETLSFSHLLSSSIWGAYSTKKRVETEDLKIGKASVPLRNSTSGEVHAVFCCQWSLKTRPSNDFLEILENFLAFASCAIEKNRWYLQHRTFGINTMPPSVSNIETQTTKLVVKDGKTIVQPIGLSIAEGTQLKQQLHKQQVFVQAWPKIFADHDCIKDWPALFNAISSKIPTAFETCVCATLFMINEAGSSRRFFSMDVDGKRFSTTDSNVASAFIQGKTVKSNSISSCDVIMAEQRNVLSTVCFPITEESANVQGVIRLCCAEGENAFSDTDEELCNVLGITISEWIKSCQQSWRRQALAFEQHSVMENLKSQVENGVQVSKDTQDYIENRRKIELLSQELRRCREMSNLESIVARHMKDLLNISEDCVRLNLVNDASSSTSSSTAESAQELFTLPLRNSVGELQGHFEIYYKNSSKDFSSLKKEMLQGYATRLSAVIELKTKDAEIQNFEKQSATWDEKLLLLQKQCEALEKKVVKSKEKAKKQSEKVEMLQEELVKCKTEPPSLQKTVRNMYNQAEALNEEESLEQVRKDFVQGQKSNEVLLVKQETMMRQNESALAELKAVQEERNKAKEVVRKLRDKVLFIQKQYGESQRTAKRFESNVDELQHKLSGLKMAEENARDTISSLKAELQNATRDLQLKEIAYRNERSALQQELDVAKRDVLSVEQKARDPEREVEKTMVELSALRKADTASQLEIQRLQMLLREDKQQQQPGGLLKSLVTERIEKSDERLLQLEKLYEVEKEAGAAGTEQLKAVTDHLQKLQEDNERLQTHQEKLKRGIKQLATLDVHEAWALHDNKYQ